jgi:hypothetical protein
MVEYVDIVFSDSFGGCASNDYGADADPAEVTAYNPIVGDPNSRVKEFQRNFLGERNWHCISRKVKSEIAV